MQSDRERERDEITAPGLLTVFLFVQPRNQNYRDGLVPGPFRGFDNMQKVKVGFISKQFSTMELPIEFHGGFLVIFHQKLCRWERDEITVMGWITCASTPSAVEQ